VTFFPLPSVVLGRAAPFYLTSTEEKLAQLECLGLDVVVIVEFTLRRRRIRAAQLSICSSRICGCTRCGSATICAGLQARGQCRVPAAMGVERGYTVHSFEPVTLDGQPVSSSRIRDALRTGAYASATLAWADRFQLSGMVVQGAHRGRSLGVPTANLSVWAEHAVPANGIYACRAQVGGATALRNAVTNIGTRPTSTTACEPLRHTC